MSISRIYSTEIAAGKTARAAHVSGELDNIISQVNTNESDITTNTADIATNTAALATLDTIALRPGVTNLVSGANTHSESNNGLLVYDHAATGTLTLPATTNFDEGNTYLLVVAATAHHVVVEVPASQVFADAHKVFVGPGEMAWMSVVDQGGTNVWAVARKESPEHRRTIEYVTSGASTTISPAGIPRTVSVDMATVAQNHTVYLPEITEAMYGEKFRIWQNRKHATAVLTAAVASGSSDEIWRNAANATGINFSLNKNYYLDFTCVDANLWLPSEAENND